MLGNRPHLLLHSRCTKKFVAVLAVFALLAWGIELVAHLHVTPDTQLTAQASHFCEICAAFQVGASAPAMAHDIPKLQPPLFRAVAFVPSAQLQLTYSYRSRAPPHA